MLFKCQRWVAEEATLRMRGAEGFCQSSRGSSPTRTLHGTQDRLTDEGQATTPRPNANAAVNEWSEYEDLNEWLRAVSASVCVWNVLSVCVMRLVCRPGVSMKILKTWCEFSGNAARHGPV